MKIVPAKSPPSKAKKASRSPVKKGGGADYKILNTAHAISVGQGITQVPRKRVAALCGVKHNSSTFANGLTKLRKQEKIEFTKDYIVVTQHGMESADPIEDLDIPTTNEEFHTLIKEQYKLKGKALDMFDYLADGDEYPTKEVAQAIGCEMNSTFANLKTKMKKLGVISFTKEAIQLTDDMFQVNGRP